MYSNNCLHCLRRAIILHKLWQKNVIAICLGPNFAMLLKYLSFSLSEKAMASNKNMPVTTAAQSPKLRKFQSPKGSLSSGRSSRYCSTF